MADRRCKLTPRVHEKIVSNLRNGAYKTVAAQEAGIARSTFNNWMERGEMEEARLEEGFAATPGEKKYLDFKKDVDKAMAQAEVNAVKVIQEAGSLGTWQAAAWYLERSFPQRWAKVRPMDDSDNKKDVADPDEALNKLLQRLESLGDREHEG